jgi:hypothetical protein
MDLIDKPLPFSEAIKLLQQKKLLPTSLTSDQLRQLNAQFLRMSMFSAQTMNEAVLAKYKEVIGKVLAPVQVQRAGEAGTVTEGISTPYAQQEIQALWKEFGYKPDGAPGSIKDLSSFARTQLVVKTNAQLGWGGGAFIQQNSNDTRIQDYPALELYRLEERKVPREWEERWHDAAAIAGDDDAVGALEGHGVMAALKSSGIWQALGDGAGGFDDTLNNPFPPFAFNSGMWTRDVERAEAVKYGLIEADEEAKPADFDFASLFKIAA